MISSSQGMNDKIDIKAYGERGLLLNLGEGKEVSEETNRRVKALWRQLRKSPPDGLLGIIPAFSSLTLYFDLGKARAEKLRAHLKKLALDTNEEEGKGKTISIPLCYGGQHGPDLVDMARHQGMKSEDLIDLHLRQEFRVYMMGFLPGFAYLGDMPSPLPFPRKASSRVSLPKGSVGLAGHFTGIYPQESAGGWQIIGRTPVPLLLPDQDFPFLITNEDRIIFQRIDEKGYQEWASRIEQNDFSWNLLISR